MAGFVPACLGVLTLAIMSEGRGSAGRCLLGGDMVLDKKTAISEDKLAKQLWAIGDATRLRLLRLLPDKEDCGSGNNVSALAEKLGLSQPTVSHHLRVLRQAGIITNRKMCRDVYYWIESANTEELVEELRRALSSESLAD